MLVALCIVGLSLAGGPGRADSTCATGTATACAAAAVGVPANQARPRIAIRRARGTTLVASPGRWARKPSSFSYRWYRCGARGARCTQMSRAARTLRLGPAGNRFTYRVLVLARNARGSSAAASGWSGAPAPAARSGASDTSPPAAPASSSRWWSESSFLNTPLSGGQVVPSSARWVQQLYNLGAGLWTNYEWWTTPVYHATTSTATASVLIRTSGKRITIPYTSAFRPDNTDDSAVAVIDDSTGCEYEFEMFDPNSMSANGEATFNIRTGSGAHVADNGTTGSELSMLAGMITPSDVKSGVIAHALRYITPFNAPTFVAPATRSDGTNAGGIPQGQLMRLDPSVDLTSYNLTPYQLMVARALQRYGAYDSDSGGGFAIWAENTIDGSRYAQPIAALPRELTLHLQFLAPPAAAINAPLETNTAGSCNQQR